MSLQAIEAAPKRRHPSFGIALHRSETIVLPSVMRRGISSQWKQASIAPIYRRPSSKTFDGLRQSTKIVACAFAAVGVAGCIVWLVIDAPGENGLYRKSNGSAAAFVAPIESREKSNALADRPLLVPRAEFDALRSRAEAAEIKQQQALDQERAKTGTLAHEVASLQQQIEALRTIDSEEAVQAAAALIKQMRALDQERARADALARELGSVRNELAAGNRQTASLNALAANARPVLPSRKPPVDSAQEELVAELSSTGGRRRAPKRTSRNAIALSPEHSSTSELTHRSALTARIAVSDRNPKVAVGTDRPASASAAFRSPAHRLRMHHSSKPPLAGLALCLNVSARELPSCRFRSTTRTNRHRAMRRLAASAMRRSGSKSRNDDQLVESDLSKGATR